MIYFNFLNLRIKFTFFLGNVLQLNNIKCHFCHINYNRVRMVLEIIKLIKKTTGPHVHCKVNLDGHGKSECKTCNNCYWKKESICLIEDSD